MQEVNAKDLYHLTPIPLLQNSIEKGETYYPSTYQQDGFTHLTSEPTLLLSVANHFYRDSKDDWVLLVLDPTKLKGEVKFEPAAAVGNKPAKTDDAVFPHLYGGIDCQAVRTRLPVIRDADGKFTDIEGLEAIQ